MNAVDILKYGHLTLMQSLKDMPENALETGGACGVWSVKDVVAHLASYEHFLVEVLTSFLAGGETPYMKKMGEMGQEKFNDKEVDERRDKSYDAILTEYDLIHQRAMELAPMIPPEVWRSVGTLPWYGAEYALDDYVVYAFYGHKREHAGHIDIFRERMTS